MFNFGDLRPKKEVTKSFFYRRNKVNFFELKALFLKLNAQNEERKKPATNLVSISCCFFVSLNTTNRIEKRADQNK